uniref:Uncharacterized protein n=1 Tax=Avena sativa TaxID=4498 RepID=A0ACD5VNW3_AVESA
MHVLWLLAARRFRRRAVSTITASAMAPGTPCGYGEDDGPFFDLDLSCCSAPASSAGSSSESEDSSCAGGEVDFVISLQRSCSAASPSYERLSFGRCGWGALPPQLKFCASEPNDAAANARFSASGRRGKLRTLSFGSAKAAFYGGRASFSRSSNSARSARVFAAYGGHGSPDQDQEDGANKRAPSADVIRRYLSKISRRLRRVAPGPAAADLRLRKSRSASAAQTAARAHSSSPSRRDDSLLEKQDGIASAIAHCKESIHRASMSECDSSLLRSWSDPGT